LPALLIAASRDVPQQLTRLPESVYRRYAVADEAAATVIDLDNGSKVVRHSPGHSENLDVVYAAANAAKKMVGRDGIEPPTPGFSVLCSTN
jgi:hypothetical protein